MPDPRLKTWADVLVDYSVAVKPGDVAVVTGGVAAEPLLRAIVRAVSVAAATRSCSPSFPNSRPTS